jgi:hypothetical protein
MICDICNAEIPIKPACLLGTKEVVTSKECWKLYLNGLITDHVMTVDAIADIEALQAFVGQMASSDTPWALCQQCTTSLRKAGFDFRHDPAALPPHGHALCRNTSPMVFVALDDEGMKNALKAAHAAVYELFNIRIIPIDPSRN